MASWQEASWASTLHSGVPRRERRSGAYRRYLPDSLLAMPVLLGVELSHQTAVLEREVRSLGSPQDETLASIARFLLRSEAIASSRIEGVAPSPQQVALAELGREETVRGLSDQARLVANNMTVVQAATTELVQAGQVTVEHIVDLHRALLPEEPRHHGLRTVQNWIGGSDRHPIDADFVPPSADMVPTLMQDLVDYLNGAAHSPLVQAALLHAQFETIHPFTDGNGRVGRALIHTVLTRRGLTTAAVLPVSLVLATLRDAYVAGLTSYRHEGPPESDVAQAAMQQWLGIFIHAASLATEQSIQLLSTIEELRSDWLARLSAHRASLGVRQTPRADSATARLLPRLPEAPVVTAGSLQRILDVSFPAASTALEELAAAGVLRRRKIERGTTAYMATEILDLITHTERRLASTRFDTRVSGPHRGVPASPNGIQP